MAKVNIKSDKITPFGGIYYACKAFYALSLDKVINGTLGVRSSRIKKFVFHFRRMRQMDKDGKKLVAKNLKHIRRDFVC